MNLLTNSKFISIVWWLIAPVLVAKLFISFGLLFLDTKDVETLHVDSKKSVYMYSFPKFFTTTLKQKPQAKKVKRTQTLGNLKLKACYMEKGREFVIVSEGSKTIFIDLQSSHKGAKLIALTSSSATFLKDGEHIELTLVQKVTVDKPVAKVSSISPDDSYISVKRDSFKKYIASPQKALRDIRFQEVKEDKKFAGLRLSFIRKGSLFDKMGLKKGDKIRAIDGKNLTSMMDLLPYYNSLENITTLQISFKRDKEIKEIMYEIN